MSVIQINYDLKKPGRDYQPVYDYIKRHPWCHLLDSCWLIRTNKSPGQVIREIKAHVDRNDEVAVFDVTGVSWATNFKDDATAWMHQNMGTTPVAA